MKKLHHVTRITAATALLGAAVLASAADQTPIAPGGLEPFAPTAEGLQAVVVGGQIGFADASGLRIAPTFEPVDLVAYPYAYRFSHDRAAAKTAERGWVLIDRQGRVLVDHLTALAPVVPSPEGWQVAGDLSHPEAIWLGAGRTTEVAGVLLRQYIEIPRDAVAPQVIRTVPVPRWTVPGRL